MKRRNFWILAFLCVGLAIGNADKAAAAHADVSLLDANDPMSWLVKSACIDSHNLVLPVDPYGGCPAGARIRKLRSGDPLAYHNIEQIGYQQRDAYPLYDPVDGKTRVIATFDYWPFNQFNLTNGSDGYDVYRLQDGWATITNTSDGGGYGQTFFGRNCVPGGWALFPNAGFLSGGEATLPIAGVDWEQTGQSYPGACPLHYSTDTKTSWVYKRKFEFGGVNGSPTKTMDTVISYHGLRLGQRFLHHGHIEVFYFTREYGITRWEVWTPAEQNPTPTTECDAPATETYDGVGFVVRYCHDWSNAIPTTAAQLPLWPIPNINLLARAHFDGTMTSAWNSEGKSAAGNPLKWSAENSTALPDTRLSSVGVRYLRLDCAAESDDRCGSGLSEAIYQDVARNKFANGGNYAFGVGVRTEAGPGDITVTLQQIDGGGKVISTVGSTSATVLPDNGTPGHQSAEEASSVYLSSRFVANTARVQFAANTAKIRFLISPQSPGTFDILDAWLAPWPAPARFGTMP